MNVNKHKDRTTSEMIILTSTQADSISFFSMHDKR